MADVKQAISPTWPLAAKGRRESNPRHWQRLESRFLSNYSVFAYSIVTLARGVPDAGE